jgi:small-conductance mechanosensitive channel
MNVAALLAGLGLTSAVLAFALKDTIEQAITGVFILFQKPFKVGDVIEIDGIEGVVQDIAIRATIVKTFDGLQVLIPNNRVYQGIIRNKSFYSSRRAMITLGVAYENDLAQAQEAIVAAVKHTSGVMAEPAPTVAFEAFDGNSIRAVIRYWYEPLRTDAMALQTAVTESIVAAALREGVKIPQPAQAVLLRLPEGMDRAAAASPSGTDGAARAGSG